jgi:putative hemolysin
MHTHESALMPQAKSSAHNSFSTNTSAPIAGYSVRLAQQDELERVFRLRYDVFYKELGASNPTSNSSGLDVDVYDSICDHLIAVHEGEIVGTYRILPVARALDNNLVPYCSTEFDITPLLETYGAGLVELGRTCVAKEHRNGVVPRLLWKFLLRHILRGSYSALIGCVSVHDLDDAQAIQAGNQLRNNGLWHPHWNLTSRMPAHHIPEDRMRDSGQSQQIELPSLMKAYSGLGAKVCGGPAMDRDFGCADYLMLAEVCQIPERYLRLFLA